MINIVEGSRLGPGGVYNKVLFVKSGLNKNRGSSEMSVQYVSQTVELLNPRPIRNCRQSCLHTSDPTAVVR